MSEVKERGFQYIIFVTVVLAILSLAIIFKPKEPETIITDKKDLPVQTDSVRNSEAPDTTHSDTDFEKILSEDNTDSTAAGTDKPLTDADIEQWYKDLLKEYMASADHISDYHDVVIRYYRKSSDAEKVDDLRKLGFYIHERPTKKELKDYYTNTIYYGDSIKREDILVVAYQLLQSGVRLQAIEHSRFGDNWKSHSIELGTDTTMLKKPVLSLDTIRYIVENNPYIKLRM